LKGLDIPLSARIIAVADTFDAMTTDRPYRKGLSFETAFAELRRGAGEQFDPAVVEAFFKALQQNLWITSGSGSQSILG
jgi:HD-GYP domain-containing protein (c-di-GMP phosphodiesterase class II)